MASKPTSNNPDSQQIYPPAVAPTSNTPYIQPYIGKLGWDTDDPQLFGLGASPDNGVTFHVFASFDGLVINNSVIDKMWPGVEQRASDFVDKEVKSAQAGISSAVAIADSAASAADSAVANSKVNSDAIAAMSSAVSAAKSGADQAIKDAASAIAGVGSTANAIKSDAAAIQSQVSAAQSANAASVKQMQSDISDAQQRITTANDAISKAKSAAEESHKAIESNVAAIQATVAQNRKDIQAAQAANSDTAQQLAAYTSEAQAQGKTIKQIESDADSTKLTIADIKGNVTQVQASVTGLQDSLKDTNGNVATVKAQADGLSSTLTDAKKDIANLTATATKLSSSLQDADGRLSTVEQTASEQSSTISDVKGNLSQLKQSTDSLTATLKDTQNNIAQVQATAKGLSEQMSDAQGDITDLQKTATGIQSTLEDHSKNIATLQSRADKLESDMKDAKGNITTAMQTASQASVTASDAKSNVATVVTTASEAYAAASDANSNATQAKLTASAAQVTASDAKSDVMTVTTTASDAKLIATNAQSQALTAEATANKFDVRIAGVEGSLNDVKDKTEWKEIDAQTDMNTLTTQQNVFLKNPTNQPPGNYWWYVRVVPGTGNRITQYAVSDRDNKHYSRQLIDNDWTAWTKTADQTDIADLNGKITTNATAIDQNKKEIALSAKQATVDNLSNQLSEANAQLKVQAGQISAKADSTTVTGLTDTINGLKDAANWKIVSGPFDANNCKTTQHIFYQDTQAKNTPNSGWFYLAVNAPRNDRVTQTLTKDNSTDTWTRFFLNNTWSMWQKEVNPSDLDPLRAVMQKNSTEITNNANAILLKADKSVTDALNKSYSDQQATLQTMAGEIQSKVTSADVKGILSNGKYATENYAQSILDQKADELSSTITEVKRDMTNGQNDVANKISNITQSIDGIQTNVSNKADKSQVTQLSDTIQLKLEGKSLCTQTATEVKWTGKQNEWLPIADLHGINDITAGTQVTLSFKYQSWSGDVTFLPQFNNDPWIPFGDVNSSAVHAKDGVVGYYRKTITVSDDSWKNSKATQLCIRCDNFTGVIMFANVKLTTGDSVSSEIDMLNNDLNLRVKKGNVVSQINQEAGGNTLIEVANGKGKLYLDADSTVFSGKAFIPSAAITNLDADKITTGVLKVPMSDGNGNTVQIGNDGIDLVSVSTAEKLFNANRGYARVNITAAGMAFGATTNGYYEQLGALSPLLDETDGQYSGMINQNGIGFVVETQQQYGYPYGGDFFSLARSVNGPPSYYNGFLYEATGAGKHPIGSHFFDPIYIHPWGADNYIQSFWVSWSGWDNGEKYPALVQAGNSAGGICFPKSGRVTLFDANGNYYTPNHQAGAYTNYQHSGNGNAYSDVNGVN